MKNFSYLLFILFSFNITNAQAPNDCVNAITICGNGVFTSNASGIGTFQEVAGCSGFEHNSIWLKITIAQGGTLGFDIKPLNTDIITDYDFWVYGPNRACASLGSPIRCCTTNPVLAGLSSNYTGMNGTSIAVTAGPGANGSGYVRWLTVTAGETYYIAIDRPVGDGGFELHWTGTAFLTAAPIANTPTDYITCSNTPDIGIFNLNSKRSEISSNLTSTTVAFFSTLADAVDNVSDLPDMIANVSNPQLISARVTDNTTGCFSISQFNLVVTPCMGNDSLLSNNFKVLAYPNPFVNDFVVDVVTENQELLKIKVYDILGKLVEERNISPSKIVSQKMGQKYPAGVYNVIISQEDEVKVLRLIKE